MGRSEDSGDIILNQFTFMQGDCGIIDREIMFYNGSRNDVMTKSCEKMTQKIQTPILLA